MANVKIGGIDYEVPELNFIALERAWPFIETALLTQDPMEGTSAGISIIAAGLIESDKGFDPSQFNIKADEQLTGEQVFERVVVFLKRKLKAGEINLVRECVNQITEEAGLREDEAGEALAPEKEAVNPSPETAADTSQSSLPLDAREAAGTA